MRRFKLKTWLGAAFLIAALLVRASAALAQGSEPGQRMVPLGYCQLGVTALTAAVKLSSCVRASFTATAGANNTQLVVTAVTGILLVGDQIVSGTGLTAGTIITGQISGTPGGGAGTYQLSATNTASAATVTSGGIPPGATSAFLESEIAGVRYRDDGGAPTAAIGALVVNGIPGILYTGTLSQLQFIAASGSPLLDIAFYRQ
jgi:hypothetical protein